MSGNLIKLKINYERTNIDYELFNIIKRLFEEYKITLRKSSQRGDFFI